MIHTRARYRANLTQTQTHPDTNSTSSTGRLSGVAPSTIPKVRKACSPSVPIRKKYVKKNTELNIANQALSFVCSERKSSVFVLKLVKSMDGNGSDIFSLFYAYTKVLKKHRNKYVNRKVLSDISTNLNCERLQEIVKSPAYSERLPIPVFCRLVRTLLHYFLSNVCHLSVFASSKLKKTSYV